MILSVEVKTIISVLNQNGHEAYVVGGSVRDFLLGKTPSDYDITTDAKPVEIKKYFKRTFDTGLKHGTVSVIIGDNQIEVTTYRIDGAYLDNRRPKTVEFTKSLKEDLKRRDFTINAIAYHPSEGYIDYFGGRRDLNSGIVRCVGEPAERFREDALRMLRAVRFSAQLGFSVDGATLRAIGENADLLGNISAERIRDELIKIIIANPGTLDLLVKTRLIEFFSPILHRYIKDNLSLITNALLKLEHPIRVDSALCAFFLFMGDNAAKTRTELNKLRLDKKTVNSVLILIEYFYRSLPETSKDVRKILSEIGAETYRQLLRFIASQKPIDTEAAFRTLDKIIADGDAYTVAMLDITGRDLLELGLAGATIGETQRKLLDLVIGDPTMNERGKLLRSLQIPTHIAIIMDGNGRWAKKRRRSASFGHHKGARTLRRLCEDANDLGLKYLTVYAFSTENWRRSENEVTGLMNLIRRFVQEYIDDADKKNLRMRTIGDLSKFEPDIREMIELLEHDTADKTGLTVILALNYGGRDDIVRAVKKICANTDLDINEQLIDANLDTKDFPAPELIIRTAGEQRLSNFLLWQSAYAELYFDDCLWPDYSIEHLKAAIDDYNARERRFGGRV